MYRKIIVVKQPEDLTIQLPDEYLNKAVEVIAFAIGEEKGPDPKSFAEEKSFFESIAVDLSGYQFERSEANGH